MSALIEYEQWKQAQQRRNAGLASIGVSEFSTTNPDQYAKDLQLGKAVGAPTPMVEEYRDLFTQRLNQKRNETILSSSPILAEWIRAQENAKVAHDDIEGLSNIEAGLNAAGNALSRGVMRVPAAGYGFLADEAAQRASDRDKTFGDLVLDEANAARANPQGARLGDPLGGINDAWRRATGLPAPADVGSAGMRYLQTQLAQAIGLDDEAVSQQRAVQYGEALKRIEAIPMSGTAEAFKHEFMAGDANDLGAMAQKFANDPAGAVAFLVEVAAESVPNLAAATGVTLLSRNPAAGAAFMGASSGATERYISPADFLAKEGIDLSDPAQAQAALADPELWRRAQEVGAARGLMIGLFDTLSGGIAGTQLASSPAGNMLLQVFAQAILGGGGEAAGQVASGEELDLRQVVLEAAAEMVTAPLEVGGVGGRAFLDTRKKAKAAERQRVVFEQLSGKTVNSKLKERLPNKLQEFIDRATANGPVDSVYIPADRFTEYFQGKQIDPRELAAALPGVSIEDMEAAIATGGDIRIPTGTYAAHLAGSEHDAFLLDNMRFDPDAMTAAEAREFNERSSEALQEAYEQAEALRLQEEEFQAEEIGIYDTMVSRLRAAGRSTDVARNEAMIYPAFYRVMAQRSGMTTEELLRLYALPEVRGERPEGIRAKTVDELTRSLATLRKRVKGLSERQVRGPSLLDFLSEVGLNDVGGDVAAIEVKPRPGRKKLLRQDGLGLDKAAQAAVDSGYLADDPIVAEYRAAQEQGREEPDLIPALIEAIRREAAGTPSFRQDANADAVMESEAFLDDLETYIAQVGGDLSMSDEEIRALLQQAQAGEGREYQQAAATESEAFKRWFGDSKVIDENGKPLVVYHGTNANIDAFTPSSIGSRWGADEFGYFFTASASEASGYATKDGREADNASVIPAYLSIQNPLDWRQLYWMWGGDEAAPQAEIDDFARRELDGRGAVSYFEKSGQSSEWKEWVEDNGYDGIVLIDPDSRTNSLFVAIEPTQIKSVNNRGTFDAADPRLLFQRMDTGPRGSLQLPLNGIGSGQAIINLFGQADLSTFVHESGHLFLSMYQALAAQPNASEQVKADYAAVMDWWRSNAKDVAKDGKQASGVDLTADDVLAAIANGTTGDAAKDSAVDVGMQEQWARAFETYLMEGKAPSVELRGAFERFRAWLLNVYRKLTSLNVNVSPELRGVFDRMLATDEEIAEARETAGFAQLFSDADQARMSPSEWATYQRLARQAEDDAAARLLKSTMEPIRRANEKWFRDERAKVKAEVTDEINRQPVYRIIEWLGNRRWIGNDDPGLDADMRMSKDILVERYGEGVLSTLPRGRFTVYKGDGGFDPDELAGWFGFDSGDAMIRAMEQAPKRTDAIEAETDRVMRERHGDVLRDGSVQEEALKAVHGDKAAQLLAAEARALATAGGLDTGRIMSAQQAKELARQTLNRMKVRDAARPQRFLAAERKAGRAAQRALAQTAGRAASGRAGAVDAYQEALRHKQNQMVNQALYSESLKVVDEVEKAERFVAKLGKKSTREKLAGDYLEAIDELLERYDFRKLSGRAEQRRAGLAGYIERMRAEGRENELAIPDYVIAESRRTPYKTLSVEYLRGVVDSLRNIEHTARLKKTLQDAKSQRELDAVVEEVTAAFEANVKPSPPSRFGTKEEAGREARRSLLNVVLNPNTLVREIDGYNDFGAAYRAFKADIDAAVSRLAVRRRQAGEDFERLYSVYTADERRRMNVREFVPTLGESLTKWQRISIALNMGNEGNFLRLTNPKARGSFTQAQLDIILATLDERDADFVQSVWDYVNSFWPDIEAREKRKTGVAPEKIPARPVSIAGKMLRGGYYPLKYDPRLDTLAADREAQDIAQSVQAGRFAKAQTRNGHLKARAENNTQPILVDISVLQRHVQQVIYDLELSEPVANSWRVLQDQRIRNTFKRYGKDADWKSLETWLKDVAEGEIRHGDALSRTMRKFRTNFTAAKIGLNLSTVLLQVTGFAQSVVVIGKQNYAKAFLRMMKSGPIEIGREIMAKSPFMTERQNTFQKDIFDFFEDPNEGPGASRWNEFKRKKMGPAAFFLMQKVQFYTVDIPTWLAGYQRGLEQFGGDEGKSVAYADDVVKRAQASGLFSDRSAIERGTLNDKVRQSESVRIFTTLGSYLFAKFNVAYERTQRTSFRNPRQVLSWTIDMAFLFTLEAVLMGLIKGRLPGMGEDDDEDDQGWAEFLATETGLSVLATIPFLRDAGSVYRGFSGGGAYGGIMEEFVRPGLQAKQGEIDAPLVKSAISLAGLFTGIPSAQINRAVDAGWREIEGDDVAPAEYLFGRR